MTEQREPAASNDAVRGALKAAAGTWACECHPSAPCAMCMRYAAKAVSAFLRAAAGTVFDVAPGRIVVLDDLADAVEEVARG